MKKSLSFFCAAIMMLSMTSCSNDSNGDTSELALVTDYGSIDDKAFNQGAWEGVKEYAEKNDKTCAYYRPTEKSTDGYMNGIQMAVNGGAKVVVCPGYMFEEAIYKSQDIYPDVKFIMLDGAPKSADGSDTKIADNTYSIVYAEQQAGFLAGYAIVKDGFKNIGFLGGAAIPPVLRFGYGYIQGAEYAAKELGLNPMDITIKYGYTGNFEPTPENQTRAASWYQTGTDVIFSCGALILNNVSAAAEAAGEGKYVIGVDVDQKNESERVITSAMKMLSKTVYDGVDMYYKGEFPGGKQLMLGIDSDAVGLPTDFSRFKTFNEEQYNDIYNRLKNNTDNICSSIITEDSNGNMITLDELRSKLEYVTIVEQ